MTTNVDTIRELLDEGLSRRAIAARLGIDEKSVRNALRRTEPAAKPTPAPTAEPTAEPDYIPPGPLRVLPEPERDGALAILPRSPTKAFIRCPGCGHAAWRTAPGRPEWECGCVVGPHGCHGPRLVPDAEGTVQITYGPYLIRRFGDRFVG
jgi:hypothetical protein